MTPTQALLPSTQGPKRDNQQSNPPPLPSHVQGLASSISSYREFKLYRPVISVRYMFAYQTQASRRVNHASFPHPSVEK